MPRPRNRRRLAGPPGPHREETSAGGLVVDIAGAARAALIARYDRDGRLRWSLPKGHIEGAETIEEAAVREVEEETGIRGRIVAPLGAIDYWFFVRHTRSSGPDRPRAFPQPTDSDRPRALTRPADPDRPRAFPQPTDPDRPRAFPQPTDPDRPPWHSPGRGRVHKTVHHHLLLATGGILSDADPEVAKVAWVPLAEVVGRLAHADERRLVAHVPELLAAIT
ncbi:NUDIX domain-containing protein [Actinoallomurus acaciae]|uniref:NUDIX domain-containing protein n=1 Tax=Actinoallomurus acaciae TaxID=502577 RepID=A0ABV5Y6F2_9ACTN